MNALDVRDRVLEALSHSGAEWVQVGPLRLMTAELGKVKVAHRTPFQTGGDFKLPYGLDVWESGKKVLNVEWRDPDVAEVVTFKPGPWVEAL